MIWNPDPELINLFGYFSIRYYGLLFVSGLFLGYLWVKRQHRLEGLATGYLEDLILYIAAGTAIGARLGHCLFYEPGYYLRHPLEMILPFSIGEEGFHFTGFQGLASHGGAIGVTIAIILFSRRYKKPLWPILDKVAVAVPLAGACIRLGNFMNSEILGHPTFGPFAVVFARVDQIPRHPAQLYEAIAYFLLFLFLVVVYKKTALRKKEGFISGLFLSLLFFLRFFLELFKIDQVGFEAGMTLNMGQWLSVPFVLIGVGIMLRGLRTKPVID